MKIYTLIILSFVLIPCNLKSSTITLRIRSYPTTENIIKNLKKPGIIAHHTLQSIHHGPITGIFATYAGYLEASNSDGFITFPRKNTVPKLNILITPQITPIVMFEQTIQNWQIIPGIPARWYSIERVTDTETSLLYWQIQEAPTPSDLFIPLDTIVIIAEPQNIYFPVGITLTDGGPNLVLPSIYTRPELHIIENSLYILQLAHFFRPAQVLHVKKELYYAEQLND